MLLFHHRNDEIHFTHKNTRHLSDILSRISAPIPPGSQFEDKIPILHFHKNQQSLALRHQPHIPSDPLDIYRSLRDRQFFPGDIPEHDSYSPSFKSFQPLLDLKTLPLISDGHIPTQLKNYCATKNNINPNDDAASIVAVITQCAMKLENERREQILNLMYIMGSPVLHLDPTNDVSINLLSCQKCNRQTTTLWRIPKEDNRPKTTTLREEIITNLLSCDPFFTTELVTISSQASLKTNYLSKRLYSCYLCAIPVIEEQRETKMNETNNHILNDLRNIIRNERPCLEFTHKQITSHPWGAPYDTTILNLEVTDPKDETQTGIIYCLAPKNKPKEETNYVIRYPNPDSPSSYSYTIWNKSAVIEGVTHHRSLHNIHTNDINAILLISQPNPIKITKGHKII